MTNIIFLVRREIKINLPPHAANRVFCALFHSFVRRLFSIRWREYSTLWHYCKMFSLNSGLIIKAERNHTLYHVSIRPIVWTIIRFDRIDSLCLRYTHNKFYCKWAICALFDFDFCIFPIEIDTLMIIISPNLRSKSLTSGLLMQRRQIDCR